MTRTLAILTAALAAVLTAGTAQAQDMTPPDVLVKTVTLEVVDLIAKDKEIRAGDGKGYAVMVGGVSLVANYRTEFNQMVRESGIEGLIKNLAAKNRALEGADKR